MDDPSKSRIARDLRTAEKIEEYYLYASSDAALCFTYYIKFIITRPKNENLIPILISNKNEKLPQLIKDYEKLFQIKDDSTRVSTYSSINTISY